MTGLGASERSASLAPRHCVNTLVLCYAYPRRHRLPQPFGFPLFLVLFRVLQDTSLCSIYCVTCYVMTQLNGTSMENILQYRAGICISRLTILCMLGILSNRRLLQQLHSSPTIPGLGSREGRIHSKVRNR
jgi:hypothetical protein